jgi:hypothetical protein
MKQPERLPVHCPDCDCTWYIIREDYQSNIEPCGDCYDKRHDLWVIRQDAFMSKIQAARANLQTAPEK